MIAALFLFVVARSALKDLRGNSGFVAPSDATGMHAKVLAAPKVH